MNSVRDSVDDEREREDIASFLPSSPESPNGTLPTVRGFYNATPSLQAAVDQVRPNLSAPTTRMEKLRIAAGRVYLLVGTTCFIYML